MIPIQILGLVLLLVALGRVVARWRGHLITFAELSLWVCIFGGILAVVLDPSLSSKLARLLGIGRGADVIVYGSVVLLFLLVFRVYVHLENIEHKLTTLVREIALDRIEGTASTAGREEKQDSAS